MLKWLKKQVGPREPTPEELFRQHVSTVLQDSVLTEDEWQELKAAAADIGLTFERAVEIYREAADHIIEQRVAEALEDGWLTPSEDRALAAVAADLKVDIRLLPQMEQALLRAKHSWGIAHLPLPVVASPLGLQKGEVAHMWVTAEALEERQRTRAVSFAGPTISIPIVKGVRYRMGRYNVGRETYQYSHSHGFGTLVVTNKRLIFAGSRSFTARHANILDVEGYSDGVRVTRTSGKPLTYIYGADNRDFGVVLARSWADGR